MKGKAHTLLQTFTDLSQNSLHCIVDCFVGVELLGGVYEREVKGRVTTGDPLTQLLTHWALTKSLTRTAFQQIALVGTLVKLLRHREQHLNRLALRRRFVDKICVTEGIDKTTLTLAEHSAYSLERSQSLAFSESKSGHSSLFYGSTGTALFRQLGLLCTDELLLRLVGVDLNFLNLLATLNL